MKTLLPLGAASLFVLLLLGSAQRSAYARLQANDLEGRVAELEEALAAQQHETAALHITLQAVQKYLEAQAKSASDLSSTLDLAEKQGFTKGINFESRVTLIDGWRAALQAAQKDVPRNAVTPVGEEKPNPRNPRGERR